MSKIIKCEFCNKPIKENTDGNSKYCQGHDLFELHNRRIREAIFEVPKKKTTK